MTVEDRLYCCWRSFVWPLKIVCMAVGDSLYGRWGLIVWMALEIVCMAVGDRLYGRWSLIVCMGVGDRFVWPLEIACMAVGDCLYGR